MDAASETSRELQRIRTRIHDLAEVLQQHGNKIEIGRIERENLTEKVDALVTKSATREQVTASADLVQLKLEQVRNDVAGLKDVVTKVAWVIVVAVLAAVLSTVIR